jgi:hypothetical protein
MSTEDTTKFAMIKYYTQQQQRIIIQVEWENKFNAIYNQIDTFDIYVNCWSYTENGINYMLQCISWCLIWNMLQVFKV